MHLWYGAPDGRLCRTMRGGLVQDTGYGEVWAEARAQVKPQPASVALIEIPQQLVVQQAVRRGRVAAVRARAAVEAGEGAAGLGDDDRGGGHVPQGQLGLGAEGDRALGDHHVGPEVAVRARAPDLTGEVEEAVEAAPLLPAAERGVREG